MAGLNLFSWEDMTAVVQRFVFREFFFVNNVPKETISGTVLTYDIEKPVISPETAFVSPTGSALPARMDDVGRQTVSLPYTFVFTSIDIDNYINLRRLGSTQRDVGGEQTLARHLRSVRRRCGDYVSEWLLSQMYTGVVSLTMNGVTRTIDYFLPTSHTPTAPAAWTTAGTAVLGDLENWTTLIEQDYGPSPTQAICNRSVMTDLIQNTTLQAIFGQTAFAAGVMQTGRIGRLYDLDWKVVNGRFATSTQTEGFMSSFVANNRVIVAPDFDVNWCSLVEGTVSFPPSGAARVSGMGDFDEMAGGVAWSTFADNPPGLVVYYRQARIGKLSVPHAHVYAATA